MVLDMFRFEMSLILTNRDKQTIRNRKLDLEKRIGPEMQIYLGSIRVRMILKAREHMRCPNKECVDREENSLMTSLETLRGGRVTRRLRKNGSELGKQESVVS